MNTREELVEVIARAMASVESGWVGNDFYQVEEYAEALFSIRLSAPEAEPAEPYRRAARAALAAIEAKGWTILEPLPVTDGAKSPRASTSNTTA